MKRNLVLGITVILLAAANSFADGCFVAPKFVWDKHKDINEPTQKAIIVHDAGQEDLILQVKYEGPVDEFGWLVPVPNLPEVKLGSMKCFYELSQYTQRQEGLSLARQLYKGAHGLGSADQHAPPVTVVKVETVGAYKIAVLSTKDAGALTRWLDANHFYFPKDKADVLDWYVQQQGYFVAVKINAGGVWFSSPATERKLANGELNPLQISFASDHCVFPLKISSVNGTPSEVQVYVLSRAPLLEKGMLAKQLPLIYSNDVAQAARRVERLKEADQQRRELYARHNLPSMTEDERVVPTNLPPEASPDEVLRYYKVTKQDLPDSCHEVPRLADGSWWLTKQTWTFQSQEMRDLTFEPALPEFARELGTPYGYFAAACLASLHREAIPTLIEALRSPAADVRVNAATALDAQAQLGDPRVREAAAAWVKDPEPRVRMAAVNVLGDRENWDARNAEFLVPLLRDEDAEIRNVVAYALGPHPDDSKKFLPEIQAMLHDTNPAARISALKTIQHAGLPISREELLSFFKLPDRSATGMAFSRFGTQAPDQSGIRYDLSDDEVVPLLQNTLPFARLLGLKILAQNAAGNSNTDAQPVELTLPLLKDPDTMVRSRAAALLRALTGRHFTDEQAGEWEQWWAENRTNFVARWHPEELRPRRLRPVADGGSDGQPISPHRSVPENGANNH